MIFFLKRKARTYLIDSNFDNGEYLARISCTSSSYDQLLNSPLYEEESVLIKVPNISGFVLEIIWCKSVFGLPFLIFVAHENVPRLCSNLTSSIGIDVQDEVIDPIIRFSHGFQPSDI